MSMFDFDLVSGQCKICRINSDDMVSIMKVGDELNEKDWDTKINVHFKFQGHEMVSLCDLICLSCLQPLLKLPKVDELFAIDEMQDGNFQTASSSAEQSCISHTISSKAPIAKPSTSHYSMGFPNPSGVVLQRKRKNQTINNTCPFCHFQDVNNREFQFDRKTKLCNKHKEPFTCLLENCQIVFSNREVFISHYRSHLKLPKQTFLCRTCFAVLDCSRNRMRNEHTHQEVNRLYYCCSNNFSKMSDFVLHKLLKHSTEVTVIMSIGQMKEYITDNISRLKSTSCVSTITENTLTQENGVKLFTCLVPFCGRVFDMETNNTKHFIEHAKIPSTFSVCSVCLFSSYIVDYNCNHINPQIICGFCSGCKFDTLHDLAVHKITLHLSVISCGPNNIPGCTVCGLIFKPGENPIAHYMKDCFFNTNLDEKSDLKPYEPLNILKDGTTIWCNDKIIGPPLNGGFTCKDCGVIYKKMEEYVEHLKTHNQTYLKKDLHIIVMCPICDKNYERHSFPEHIKNCTSGMQLDKNVFGCAHCQKRVMVVDSWKFRAHYLYCKSFVTLKDQSGNEFFKCLNCTFYHSNLMISIQHANATCIYFRMKNIYTMSVDEVQKVLDRKRQISENNKIDLKPDIEFKDFFNPDICNRNRQKLLGEFDYFCMFCKKKFYSEFIFKQHLNIHGIQCRPFHIEYCRFCVCDFDSIEKFSSHLNGMSIDEPLQSSIHRPIKCEVIDDTITSNDQYYEPNCSYNLNSHAHQSLPNTSTTCYQDIKDYDEDETILDEDGESIGSDEIVVKNEIILEDEEYGEFMESDEFIEPNEDEIPERFNL